MTTAVVFDLKIAFSFVSISMTARESFYDTLDFPLFFLVSQSRDLTSRLHIPVVLVRSF